MIRYSILVVLAILSSPVYWLWSASAVQAVSEPAPISDIIGILERIIKLLAPAAGIAFFIMLLVGGFQFINSGGDPKAAGQARTTLTFALIGILLVVASWLILKLIGEITGVDVTKVEFPTAP